MPSLPQTIAKNSLTTTSSSNKIKEESNDSSTEGQQIMIKTEENQDLRQQSSSSPSTSPFSLQLSTEITATMSSTSSTTGSDTTTTYTDEKPNIDDDDAQAVSKTVSNENFMYAKPLPVLLNAVNSHIMCGLCQGYLIDATTIVECLHSFCHSCLIKHLRTEQYCPRCEMMINTAKPNIKSDTTLQAIVYKLVPSLYEKELLRKRGFYKNFPIEAALATPEQRGEDTEHLIFSPSELMSLSMEYADMDELIANGDIDYADFLKARYLQCPAICTVAHLKKFVYGKFQIDCKCFNIEIMYKVKTIVLLDHYTLMDVAYIYTWKRDDPMRFYFRVKRSPTNRRGSSNICRLLSNNTSESIKLETIAEEETNSAITNGAMTIIPKTTQILQHQNVETFKIEDNKVELVESCVKIETQDNAPDLRVTESNVIKQTVPAKHFEIEPTAFNNAMPSKSSTTTTTTVKGGGDDEKNLKITLVNKNVHIKSHKRDSVGGTPSGSMKSSSSPTPTIETRKVENIKLILSKQNSVTIINMSDPERKEIVKPVRQEKEWKVKVNKKDKESSSGSSKHQERKNKLQLNQPTVPPLRIKTEQIHKTPKTLESTLLPLEETIVKPVMFDDPQSEFLKSFSLTPIKDKDSNKTSNDKNKKVVDILKAPINPSNVNPLKVINDAKLSILPLNIMKTSSAGLNNNLISSTYSVHVPKTIAATTSKRKSKEPIKAIVKKPKLHQSPSPPHPPSILKDDFKIKLPPNPKDATKKANSPSSSQFKAPTNPTLKNNKPLMPPPAAPPLNSSVRAAIISKKHSKQQPTVQQWQNKNICVQQVSARPAGSMSPHPSLGSNNGIQIAAPGNRTPIAKRYQPILPKAARPNPYANIPNISSDVNKLLKDAGTEIKSIGNEANNKVYGPKSDTSSSLMGPPPIPTATARSNTTKANNLNKFKASSNYLNLALFNASKSKGNEVPPGCRTPIYTPNSPIYSPSSPQYSPNYNIPLVPTYKYTPKPTNISSTSTTSTTSSPSSSPTNSNYLQNLLGTNSQMSSLFPAPPTKKESPPSSPIGSSTVTSSAARTNIEAQLKRPYPFTRSPSPNVEDPPEKQLKVKSLLNSCNINIPSSLSITITSDDGDSASGSAMHNKHKSPVNNYIEILKLPDSTVDNAENNSKRVTPPPPSSPMGKLNKAEDNNGKTAVGGNLKSTQQLIPHKLQGPSATSLKYAPNDSKIAKTNEINMTNPKTIANDLKLLKPLQTMKSANINVGKKTPSPDKKSTSNISQNVTSPPSITSLLSNDKNTKPSDVATSSACKKFRPILPRQEPAPEVIPPKVTTANVIGTYSSPSGVTVKVHATKKTKKSPNTKGTSTQSPTTSPRENNTIPKLTLTTPTSKSTIDRCLSPKVQTSTANSLTPSPLQSPPQSQSMQAIAAQYGANAAAAAIIKENILRAQQAVVANHQSNIFYTQLAAAQLGQQLAAATATAPQASINFQQAYLLEQFSRMQRLQQQAGYDFDYIQKFNQNQKANEKSNNITATTNSISPALNLAAMMMTPTTNNLATNENTMGNKKSNNKTNSGANLINANTTQNIKAPLISSSKMIPTSATAPTMTTSLAKLTKQANLLSKVNNGNGGVGIGVDDVDGGKNITTK